MNRITDYEPGWLSFLVDTGLATHEEARKAQNRVAIEAVRELERRLASKRRRKKKRKKPDDE